MYWNSVKSSVLRIWLRLTLTWDVLKSFDEEEQKEILPRLTLTWDVLKLLKRRGEEQ